HGFSAMWKQLGETLFDHYSMRTRTRRKMTSTALWLAVFLSMEFRWELAAPYSTGARISYERPQLTCFVREASERLMTIEHVSFSEPQQIWMNCFLNIRPEQVFTILHSRD